MYTGAGLSFALIRACWGGLVLYCIVFSDAGGEMTGPSPNMKDHYYVHPIAKNADHDHPEDWLFISISI